MGNREVDFLDALEDAQDRVASMRRTRNLLVGLSAGSLLPAIAGMWLLSYLYSIGADWGDGSGLANFVLTVIGIVAGVFAVAADVELGNARVALKAVQRQHRNYLMND